MGRWWGVPGDPGNPYPGNPYTCTLTKADNPTSGHYSPLWFAGGAFQEIDVWRPCVACGVQRVVCVVCPGDGR